jgi:SAM-dependent methyltransferase
MQYTNSKEYILPFIERYISHDKKLDVLEIGCAEAGVLKAFTDKGHQCVGIELDPNRTEIAKTFMAEEMKSGKIDFMSKNIYDIDVDKDLKTTFDLIILKDVIEHIHDQAKFMSFLHKFLKPDGKIFFGFPPWQMPFGGHQQVAKSKILSSVPYYHMLPRFIYKWILKVFGESPQKVENMLEIKDTGISIERFERILKKENYKTLKRQLYLINPIYKYKFGVSARKQIGIISAIPILRNFLSTCAYYLIEERK